MTWEKFYEKYPQAYKKFTGLFVIPLDKIDLEMTSDIDSFLVENPEYKSVVVEKDDPDNPYDFGYVCLTDEFSNDEEVQL